jgi:hypothetical protein
MSSITIQRSREYNNRFRNFRIFIDDREVGKVGNGEAKTFNVTPGRHRVMAKIDWCGSEEVEVDVQEHETRILAVSGFRYGNWLMPLSSGIIALHFILQMTLDFSYTIVLVLPVFLFLFYLVTFGRKKYLRVAAISS